MIICKFLPLDYKTEDVVNGPAKSFFDPLQVDFSSSSPSPPISVASVVAALRLTRFFLVPAVVELGGSWSARGTHRVEAIEWWWHLRVQYQQPAVADGRFRSWVAVVLVEYPCWQLLVEYVCCWCCAAVIACSDCLLNSSTESVSHSVDFL